MNRTTYGCLAHHKRGARVCDKALRLPMVVSMRRAGRAGTTVLRPRVVMAVIDGVLARDLSHARQRTECRQSRAALHTVEREIGDLAARSPWAATLEPCSVDLRTREARRRELLDGIAPPAPPCPL